LKNINHVAIYLRISQEKKSEGTETLDNHRQLLTEYAISHGYTFEEYGEVLSGGASEMVQRPQLQKLLSEIEKFDAILVVELSRLSRNGLISETVLQYCADYDKPIITPVHTYDLANNNNDVLTFRFGSLIASQEHALIGKRSKTNKMQMARNGLHVSGGVPYGYRRNSTTKKLEIHEEESEVVRYIFQLHFKGYGSRRIVDELNRLGYKPSRSNAWQLPSVKRIIKNPTYCGTIVFQDRKRVKEGQKYTYKVMETIEIPESHEPIIEPNDWIRANQMREQRANTRIKPSKTIHSIITDLVYCGACNRKMTLKPEQNGKVSLKTCDFQLPNSAKKCTNCGMLAEHLENEVMQRVKGYRKELEEVLNQLEDNNVSSVESDLRSRLSHVISQIGILENEQRDLINLALKKIFTHDEIKDKKQEIINQLQSLEITKEQLETELGNMNVKPIKNRIKQTLTQLDEFDSVYSIEIQNNILKEIIKKISYTRVIPKDIRKLSTRNPERRNYPYEYEIEYY
jgi:site-specific DNA recombinase